MSVSLPELDLLLTGGRLVAKHAVQAAYQRDGWKVPREMFTWDSGWLKFVYIFILGLGSPA